MRFLFEGTTVSEMGDYEMMLFYRRLHTNEADCYAHDGYKYGSDYCSEPPTTIAPPSTTTSTTTTPTTNTTPKPGCIFHETPEEACKWYNENGGDRMLGPYAAVCDCFHYTGCYNHKGKDQNSGKLKCPSSGGQSVFDHSRGYCNAPETVANCESCKCRDMANPYTTQAPTTPVKTPAPRTPKPTTTSTTTTTTITTTPPTTPKPGCIFPESPTEVCKQNGSGRHAVCDCSHWTQCWNAGPFGMKHTGKLKCPDGSFFDHSLGNCNGKELIDKSKLCEKCRICK